MEMIYTFEKFIYQRDMDILAGWNQESFDCPYLYWRYLFHAHVLKEKNLRIPNFGTIVGGFSNLRKEDGLYKKGDCEVVSTDLYTKNDGLVIWRQKHVFLLRSEEIL